MQPTRSELVKMPVWHGQTERANVPPAAPLERCDNSVFVVTRARKILAQREELRLLVGPFFATITNIIDNPLPTRVSNVISVTFYSVE